MDNNTLKQNYFKEKKFFSIKSKMMIVFGLLIVFIIVVMNTISITIARQSVMEKVEIHLKAKAIDVANQVELAMHSDFEHLATMARSPLLRSDSLSYVTKARLLDKEANASGLENIYICDNKGLLHLPNGKTIDVSDREYYKKSMQGKPHMTEPFRDRLGTFSLSVTVPIYDNNNNVKGVLIGDYDGLALCKYIKNIRVGKEGVPYIIGKTGVTIADIDPEIVINQENSAEVAKTDLSYEAIAKFEQKALSENKPDVGYFYWGGVRNIASFAKIPGTGWSVIIFDKDENFLDTISYLQLVISIMGLVIVVIGLVITFIVSDRISKPIIHLSATIKEISEGNLKTITNKDKITNDEIGILSSSLLNMSKKLRHVVTEITQNSNNLRDASNKISSTSQDLLQGANEQASSTEEVSSTMEEMQANIAQNTDNSKITSEKSQKVQKNVLEVGNKSVRVVEANVLINEKVSIIREIAHQTNILALNAAVEAARAGEHGRGFAVVAAEVRKLAERIKDAADEIVGLSENTKKLSEEAGESLSAIIPEIEETAKLVENITTASIEQNSGAEQVNNSVQQLNNLAQQNAYTSEELATTSAEMTAQAESLRNVISYFKF